MEIPWHTIHFYLEIIWSQQDIGTVQFDIKPNTHRRRRRNSAVELSRVGGVYGIRN